MPDEVEGIMGATPARGAGPEEKPGPAAPVRSIRHVLRRVAGIVGRGCAVAVGAWLGWTVVVAAYVGVMLLVPERIGYDMASFAVALLVMLGYLVVPVIASVACARWIVDGTWHRVFHPWAEPAATRPRRAQHVGSVTRQDS